MLAAAYFFITINPTRPALQKVWALLGCSVNRVQALQHAHVLSCNA